VTLELTPQNRRGGTFKGVGCWTFKNGIVETKWVNAASCRMGRKKIKMYRLADLRHSG
jgi:hypothetical protein